MSFLRKLREASAIINRIFAEIERLRALFSSRNKPVQEGSNEPQPEPHRPNPIPDLPDSPFDGVR